MELRRGDVVKLQGGRLIGRIIKRKSPYRVRVHWFDGETGIYWSTEAARDLVKVTVR